MEEKPRGAQAVKLRTQAPEGGNSLTAELSWNLVKVNIILICQHPRLHRLQVFATSIQHYWARRYLALAQEGHRGTPHERLQLRKFISCCSTP